MKKMTVNTWSIYVKAIDGHIFTSIVMDHVVEDEGFRDYYRWYYQFE